MTLDGAIREFRELANDNCDRNNLTNGELRQVVEWLEELDERRDAQIAIVGTTIGLLKANETLSKRIDNLQNLVNRHRKPRGHGLNAFVFEEAE